MKFYTTKEVADRYQVHPRTVRAWIIEGRLAGHKLSRTLYRVSEAALREFETANEQQVTIAELRQRSANENYGLTTEEIESAKRFFGEDVFNKSEQEN